MWGLLVGPCLCERFPNCPRNDLCPQFEHLFSPFDDGGRLPGPVLSVSAAAMQSDCWLTDEQVAVLRAAGVELVEVARITESDFHPWLSPCAVCLGTPVTPFLI